MYMKKKNWDVNNLISQIRTIESQCRNPYNDGYTAFEIKKDLYHLNAAITEALNSSPKFAGEEEWLPEQEQQRIIKILKS